MQLSLTIWMTPWLTPPMSRNSSSLIPSRSYTTRECWRMNLVSTCGSRQLKSSWEVMFLMNLKFFVSKKKLTLIIPLRRDGKLSTSGAGGRGWRLWMWRKLQSTVSFIWNLVASNCLMTKKVILSSEMAKLEMRTMLLVWMTSELWQILTLKKVLGWGLKSSSKLDFTGRANSPLFLLLLLSFGSLKNWNFFGYWFCASQLRI
mmetsp:Transcript_12157/g.20492  ORF Transcript_12157/g.20492 Transcript_12157/m.20492 type:complete len:203 (+) Transcript_12157:416-1024(+)